MLIRLLIITCVLVLSTACSEATPREPETYILPDGYTGSFYIIFNAVDGEPRKELDGARVYQIPDSGVLLTQIGLNRGWIDSDLIKFFYQKPNGDLEQLTERWTTSITDNATNRADDNLTVFGGGVGLFRDQGIDCTISYKPFLIGSKKNC